MDGREHTRGRGGLEAVMISSWWNPCYGCLVERRISGGPWPSTMILVTGDLMSKFLLRSYCFKNSFQIKLPYKLHTTHVCLICFIQLPPLSAAMYVEDEDVAFALLECRVQSHEVDDEGSEAAEIPQRPQ